MKQVLLKIEGMSCSGCSSGLEKYLNKQEGILHAEVNLVLSNTKIEYDETKLSMQDLDRFIKEAGFESKGIDDFREKEKDKKKNKINLWISVALSIIVLYLSMSHMIGLPDIPYLSMQDNPFLFAITLFILTGIIIYLGKDIILAGIKNLVHKTPNMDTLVTIGVISSTLYSIFGTVMIYFGNLEYIHSLYYESAAIILVLVKVGRYIDKNSKSKTKQAIVDLMELTPEKAIIRKNEEEIEVSIDEIQKGDIVICRPGQKIAVDGMIVKGETHIDESFITGESVPKKKGVDSVVVAGSINYDGYIEYVAEKIGKESTVSEIVRMVIQAINTKAPIAKIADKISGYFVPAIMIIATIAFLIWLIIDKKLDFALNIFVSTLVIACPCALGLATPLAMVISTGRSAKKSILIKQSSTLENAHKINKVVFDKTGTLTMGKLTVAQINSYSNFSEKQLMEVLGSLEKKSEHPIANAITRYCEQNNIESLEVPEIEIVAGSGMKAKIENENKQKQEVLVGNRKLLQEYKIEIEENILEDEKNISQQGNSIVYVVVNQQIVGLVGVKDIIKPSAKVIVQKLKKRGIQVYMLTGDNKNTAEEIAKEIGIENIIAEVSPKMKANQIKELQRDGSLVMMCGDGINDSPSLVTADVGLSIMTGTDIAVNSSDVVIMNDNLEKIEELLQISKRTVKIIKENLFWAFFYNVCMIPIAVGIFVPFGIMINPMFAAFSMTLSSITVILNSARLT